MNKVNILLGQLFYHLLCISSTVCACVHLRGMREDAGSSENMDWSFIGSGFISINERNGFSNEVLTQRSENSTE